jgi:hypothetical protein
MPKLFNHGDKVTFKLDPEAEILIVVESRYHRTQVVTLDGIEISHATELLELAEIPSAI